MPRCSERDACRADPALAGSAVSRGSQHRTGGMGLTPIPWSKRSAQRQWREGGRDWSRKAVTTKAARGGARKARWCAAPARPACTSTDSSHCLAPRRDAYSTPPSQSLLVVDAAPYPQRSAPPRGRGTGGRQAAWGLLRDQIRSCVPFSPSIRRA